MSYPFVVFNRKDLLMKISKYLFLIVFIIISLQVSASENESISFEYSLTFNSPQGNIEFMAVNQQGDTLYAIVKVLVSKADMFASVITTRNISLDIPLSEKEKESAHKIEYVLYDPESYVKSGHNGHYVGSARALLGSFVIPGRMRYINKNLLGKVFEKDLTPSLGADFHAGLRTFTIDEVGEENDIRIHILSWYGGFVAQNKQLAIYTVNKSICGVSSLNIATPSAMPEIGSLVIKYAEYGTFSGDGVEVTGVFTREGLELIKTITIDEALCSAFIDGDIEELTEKGKKRLRDAARIMVEVNVVEPPMCGTDIPVIDAEDDVVVDDLIGNDEEK